MSEINSEKHDKEESLIVVTDAFGVPQFKAFALSEGAPASDRIDSSAWTGKQFKLVDAKIIAEVKKSAEQLRDAVNATRFESNSDSQNLKCLADALVSVCSMAEPEVTIIDRILASPKFQAYAGLATLIATVRGVLGI